MRYRKRKIKNSVRICHHKNVYLCVVDLGGKKQQIYAKNIGVNEPYQYFAHYTECFLWNMRIKRNQNLNNHFERLAII